MKELELKMWKEELQLRKDENAMKLKEMKLKLDRLTFRLNLLVDVKDKLNSSLLLETEKQLQVLASDLENIKKENNDIDTILFSIDVEAGTLFVCK